MKKVKLPKWLYTMFGVIPRFFAESENSKRIKYLFVTYFDGGYEMGPEPNTANTFAMGVCKLSYNDKKNELMVYLRRPGLLIGKGGRTIDALSEYLGCKIGITVVDLRK